MLATTFKRGIPVEQVQILTFSQLLVSGNFSKMSVENIFDIFKGQKIEFVYYFEVNSRSGRN